MSKAEDVLSAEEIAAGWQTIDDFIAEMESDPRVKLEMDRVRERWQQHTSTETI